jgi:hypothetical protein
LTASQQEEELSAPKIEKVQLESEQAEDQWHYHELENLWDEAKLAIAKNNFNPCGEMLKFITHFGVHCSV